MIYSSLSLIATLMAGSAYQTSAFSSSTRTGLSRPSLQMAAATMPPKTKALQHVKERNGGRFGGVLDIQVEDDDSADYDSFESADADEIDPPKKGAVITGKVIEMDDNGALIEIWGKTSGYIPIKEASLEPIKHVNTVMEVGQDVTAEVIGTLRGMPVMSPRLAQLATAWEEVLDFRAKDETFETEVIEVNRGGAVCTVKGLRAFLPGSHYLGIPDASIIGKKLNVKFLDVNEDEGKVVISQRRAMMDSQTFSFEKGEVVPGTITGLRNYGAFLELDGGIAGLLHISQISFDRVDNLESLFKVGQRAKVMIIDHDKVNGRVALSTKTLEQQPGDMLKDMQKVFDSAEETGKKFNERMESERQAREAAARDIVAGLGSGLDSASEGDAAEPVAAGDVGSVAESIESILASIVSDGPKEE
jgi:small subunit ribosomal protein S1